MLSKKTVTDEEITDWERQKTISEEYIRQQAFLFDRLTDEVKASYRGKFVFFENGQIKDFDDDKIALAKRIYEREGYRDIFIERIAEGDA